MTATIDCEKQNKQKTFDRAKEDEISKVKEEEEAKDNKQCMICHCKNIVEDDLNGCQGEDEPYT